MALTATLASAQQAVVPNTTLAAQKAANTSSAPSFPGMSNGNIAPSSVSKKNIHTLLYPGATTQIFAHVVGWFGSANHYSIGYNSTDPAQVHAQVTDMMSRGIDGVVIDWRGASQMQDYTATAFRNEIDARATAFSFAIMEDGGALASCSVTPGCNVTRKFVDDLNYAYATYASSPHYLRVEGHPIYFTFGTEFYSIDWSAVSQALQGDPRFIFENAGGFSMPMTAGAFAWVQPQLANATDPASLAYLTDFLWNAGQAPSEIPFAATWKGFDDTAAAWGSHRLIDQQCGQTWLATFGTLNRNFSSSHPLAFMQLVTWDDYEEGTALEPGIDNCVTLRGSGNYRGVLTWHLASGSENTIDYYSVFISRDGTHLMKLADVPAGQHTLNLASFNFAHGYYSVFVKAWGQPSITNKMSPAIHVKL